MEWVQTDKWECLPIPCECNENRVNGVCEEIPVDTSVDWSESVLYEYPDNNHDDAPRCEPVPLNEIDGCPSESTTNEVGNPIDCATGRKVQRETDCEGHGLDPLRYERTYRSPDPEDLSSGDVEVSRMWRPNGIPHLSRRTYDDGSKIYYLVIGDWYRRALYQSASEGPWEVNPSMPRLVIEPSGFSTGLALTTRHGQTHHFTASGVLAQSNVGDRPRYYYEYEEFPEGGTQVVQIRNRFGESLSFEYDGPSDSLSKLEDQDVVEIHYEYDDQGNLKEVVYPDSTPDDLSDNPRKTYLYEEPDLPHHMTGVVDERGVRYATFGYDQKGRAIRTEHAQGAGRVEVESSDDNRAVVRFYRDSSLDLYREEHYTYEKILGAYRRTHKAIVECQHCETGEEVWEYNQLGQKTRHRSMEGRVTEWTYDDQGRKETETLGVGSPEERVMVYTWSEEHDRLEAVETDAALTRYVYDAQGNLVETVVTSKR